MGAGVKDLTPLKVKLDRKYLIEFNKEETFKLLRGSLGEPRLCEEENAVEELERREATAAPKSDYVRPHYRRCPSLIPSFNAF